MYNRKAKFGWLVLLVLLLMGLHGNAADNPPTTDAHVAWQMILTTALGVKNTNEFVAVLPDAPILEEDALLPGNHTVTALKDIIDSVAQVEPILTLTPRSISEALNGASAAASPSPAGSPSATPGTASTPAVAPSPSAASPALASAENDLAAAKEALAKSTTTSAAVKKALEDRVALFEQKVRLLKAQFPHNADDVAPFTPSARPAMTADWQFRISPEKWDSSPGWQTITIPWAEPAASKESFAGRALSAKNASSWLPSLGKQPFKGITFDFKVVGIAWTTLEPARLAQLPPPKSKEWVSAGSLQTGDTITGELPCIPTQVILVRNVRLEQFQDTALDRLVKAIRSGDPVRFGPLAVVTGSKDSSVEIPAVHQEVVWSPPLRLLAIRYQLIPHP